ncbi:hypothetical protein CTheo_6842 [Ceratobasidium theobromae]|uniref:Uncharacterized protein n=1 Tax=Ceratobasidium theobromae TaxID=1582974 RepID=A0A5N5QE54_9AGAM|nr:hypothetical protein CTheo_6842 [Ceratobasidium theobromae]
MSTPEQLNHFAVILEKCDLNLIDILVSLMNHDVPSNGALQRLRSQLCNPKNLNRVAATLLNAPETSEISRRIAQNIVSHQLVREMAAVVEKSSGNHFNASHMTVEKILEFSREKLAKELNSKCPHLWQILQVLLDTSAAKSAVDYLGACNDYLTSVLPKAGSINPNAPRPTNNATKEEMHELSPENIRRTTGEKAQKRQSELAAVRCVSIFSILMQSSNARCNRLQTLVGLFTHSTHTPESVVELLAHAGLSIAPSSINNMVHSMSRDAVDKLKTGSELKPRAFGYDNLDISFKTEGPTIDYHGHIAHITTGTIIPVHGATLDDMRVSKEIWAKSPINPLRNPLEPVIVPTHKLLMVTDGLACEEVLPA